MNGHSLDGVSHEEAISVFRNIKVGRVFVNYVRRPPLQQPDKVEATEPKGSTTSRPVISHSSKPLVNRDAKPR